MRVFITGASSGIGEAMAREYRRRHPAAINALVARREQALAGVAQSRGASLTPFWPLDINDRGALEAAAHDFLQRFGVPDVVIANAGISAGTVTGEPRDAQAFERIMRTNVVAMFDTFSPFVPAMTAARAGTLVGVASVAGIRGLPGAGGYSASKAAAISYLESLRVELRRRGVGVVTLVPGFIRTPMTARNRYPMPFLTEPDVFARKAIDAIASRRSFAVIPWQMRIVVALLRLLPNALFDAAFARAPRKERAREVPPQ